MKKEVIILHYTFWDVLRVFMKHVSAQWLACPVTTNVTGTCPSSLHIPFTPLLISHFPALSYIKSHSHSFIFHPRSQQVFLNSHHMSI